jgi:EpsI family protein
MFFAIPFGEFLLPQLIDWTADFTIAALRLTGIPVYREANSFVIPSGHWSVVEACSGIRYLIASMVVGTLYAYLTYRSRTRRLVFIAASIVVPLVANWLRAYMIVMIGHLSDNKLATGVDHIIYGWLFFGVVMALLFWVASFWRQDDQPEATAEDLAKRPATTAPTGSVILALVLALIVIAVWKPALAMLNRQSDAPVLLSPVAPANGWAVAPNIVADWSPEITKPAAELQQAFLKDGMYVGMYVAYYRGHASEGKLVSSGNTLVRSSSQRWLEVGVSQREVGIGDAKVPLTLTEFRYAGDRLLVTKWYVVDGLVTTNDTVAALRSGWQRLMGRGDDGAIVIAYTRVDAGAVSPIDKLDAFATQMAESITRALAAVVKP